MYEIYFGPFTKKVWGIEGRELSADFGRERIGTYNLWDLFKRIFFGMKERGTITSENPFTDIRRFYPPSGCGEVLDALYERCLLDPRFRLHMDSEIKGIVLNGNRVTHVTTDTEFAVDYCFSTISLLDLGGYLGLSTDILSFTSTSRAIR